MVGSVYNPTFTISHFFSFYVRVQSSKADHSGKIFMARTINDQSSFDQVMEVGLFDKGSLISKKI